MTPNERLKELNITLPDAPAPAANYVSVLRDGDHLYVSGQIAAANGEMIVGKLGETMDVAEGQAAARACAISLMAQVAGQCGGDLSKVERVVKIVGFVNSTPDFIDQPKVLNGASDLLGEVFGEAGRHTRSAVSAASLPFGVAVEVEAIFRLKSDS